MGPGEGKERGVDCDALFEPDGEEAVCEARFSGCRKLQNAGGGGDGVVGYTSNGARAK